ncbi:MAG: DNA topoisomerase IV subunit B [Alphaproteobacteria bacterium]|nr:DNA topoisomerase IV subunit B [Alphaproteobacteria bacterium]
MKRAADLFDFASARAPASAERAAKAKRATPASTGAYTAKDIEVLEGLEPVRRRPGMYVGGTDERALHHLLAEVLDNAMDEAVAGHANWIELSLKADGTATVVDNGRGIPVDPHPKFRDKSALEVIMTTLHSGGKFGGKAYATSGGLHGVGISVVNALSEALLVEVAREGRLWRQRYARGKALGKLEALGAIKNRRGTTVTFKPDREIFGKDAALKPALAYRMARGKAYLFRGVEIRWSCDPQLLRKDDPTPAEDVLHFPNGLADYLASIVGERRTLTPQPFSGEVSFGEDQGRVEWAITWPADEEGSVVSHCNTIATPEGGTHEAGLRSALARSLKGYGELVGNKRAVQVTAEDIIKGACVVLSLFLRNPEFQGQTKERLSSADATRLVEGAVKDHFDHWLSADPTSANQLLAVIIERAEDRIRRRQEKEVARKHANRRARLPGKLADCSNDSAEGTEIFLVEGDSAGGSAKQARDRATQAVLPLRGKILNVASATSDKLQANQELSDLVLALGCGSGARFSLDGLRYERVIIMTDADVDGAHIAALLLTFFYREMPGLIDRGHLYLAQPPLYRLTQGGKSAYARDDADRDRLLKSEFSGRGKVEISRFKGLGEMPPAQLKETTMDPKRRTLLRVTIPDSAQDSTRSRVESLMGRKPEARLKFIQEHASVVSDLDV